VGEEELAAALKDADLVIIPAGVPRKPGMTRCVTATYAAVSLDSPAPPRSDDLFKINAGIVKNLMLAVGKNCPNVRSPLALRHLPHASRPG